MTRDISEENIYTFPELNIVPDPYLPYNEAIHLSGIPIVIDNGSYQCRVGWASSRRPDFVFKSLVAKHRGRKENETQVGNDISNIEVVRWLLKTQFDRNVVTQFDVQEIIFDHIFNHLGINTVGCVDHPIVITETVANPNYSRQLMTELLFECYQVPSIAYGIDSLFSFFYNKPKVETGLIVSCGYNTIHILPFVKNRLDVYNCRRLSIGGYHMITYLHRLLQLKYPVHFSAITLSRAEMLLSEHMQFATSYEEELKNWADSDFYDRNVHKIQLPYTPLPGPFVNTEAGKLERCHALLKRVREAKAKRKLIFYEEKLQQLIGMQEMLEDEDDEICMKALYEMGYSTTDDLQGAINKLNWQMQRSRFSISCLQSGESDSQVGRSENIYDDLDFQKFSECENWITTARQKLDELKQKRNEHISGNSVERFKSNDFEDCGALDLSGTGDNSRNENGQGDKECDIEMTDDDIDEERQDQIEELQEVLEEYDREFNKKLGIGMEHSFTFNLADYYQLHLAVERIRVPEIIFQPSLLGVDQGGIAETIQHVLARYSPFDQNLLVENVFLTGGCAALPGLKAKMETEMLAMRPFQSVFNVYLAENPVLDAWNGARMWANKENLAKYSITRADYEEKGSSFFKHHSASNWHS